MDKRTYIFEVECLEAGQRNRYGDSYYHYIITNKSDIDYDDCVIKTFCTNFVRESTEKKDMDSPFGTEFKSFKKIEDRKYEYKCEEASTH